ncbi:MAG: glycosyltransferase [Desulfomicrobium escambiense]|nr:glycosyltransferase [Desulfomicrobium escambiense]
MELIAGTENLGLARANNLGAKAARGDYLFFLNPDALVMPGAVTALVRFSLSHPEAALLGPAMTDRKQRAAIHGKNVAVPPQHRRPANGSWKDRYRKKSPRETPGPVQHR